MSKRKIYDFLRELTDNNSKQWMDTHRDEYEEAKQIWIDTCQNLLDTLAKHDDYFADIEASDTIERINNNLLYHPDRPTYKSHFGFSLGYKGGVGLYVSVSPSRSWIGGGVHKPNNDMLKNIRAAIDERGDELQKILDSDDIQGYFGGLNEDENKLKTSPKGYSQDHEHIELLRRKDFTVYKRITQEDVLGDDFPKVVEEAYLKMQDLILFMRDALDR